MTYLTMKGFNKTTPPYKTYTIVWNEVSDPSQFFVRYEDDAAGLTQGSTDFDTFFGYYGCRLSSAGVETAKVTQEESGGYGKLDITQLGTLTSGDNVMIAFPRRGIKMTKSGSVVTLSITDGLGREAEGYQYYAHTKGSDAKDTLYLGAYKMTSGYKSWSGASILTGYNRSQFRSGIQSTYNSSAGTDRYSMVTIYPRWYINALYMMKYGNPNSQSIVGQGYTAGKPNTGGTDNQTNATYGTSSSSQQVKLFGLEDFWGNTFEFLDGCWFNSSSQLTADKTNSVFKDSDYATNLGSASAGWLGGIAGTNDGMFMNTNATGSGTTYYTDYSDANSSRVISVGGVTYSDPERAGVFTVYQQKASSSGPATRLQYL